MRQGLSFFLIVYNVEDNVKLDWNIIIQITKTCLHACTITIIKSQAVYWTMCLFFQPNNLKAADNFDENLVRFQVRYLG